MFDGASYEEMVLMCIIDGPKTLPQMRARCLAEGHAVTSETLRKAAHRLVCKRLIVKLTSDGRAKWAPPHR